MGNLLKDRIIVNCQRISHYLGEALGTTEPRLGLIAQEEKGENILEQVMLAHRGVLYL